MSSVSMVLTQLTGKMRNLDFTFETFSRQNVAINVLLDVSKIDTSLLY